MIVWSRGLGKQRLPLDLANAVVELEPDNLVLKGVIDPVCWDYAIRLGPGDLRDFLKLLAQPETARFLAQRGGVLLPFVAGLIGAVPGLVIGFLARRVGLARSKEDGDAVLV